MRMIVAALVALSLPVSTAQAQERAPKRVQQHWNSGLVEGRQSAISSIPGHDTVLTLDSYSARAVEENWFARATNNGQAGGGGGGGGGGE